MSIRAYVIEEPIVLGPELFNLWEDDDQDFIDRIDLDKLNSDGYGILTLNRFEIEEIKELSEIKRTIEICNNILVLFEASGVDIIDVYCT